MKPPRFDYHRPRSVGEACELLGTYGDAAKVLAGGQSLMPQLNLRTLRPRALVDVNRVDELAYVRQEAGVLRVGALTRHCDVATGAEVTRHAPLLARAAGLVGHPAVRHRGTLGGSLAHALPGGELPCAAVALDAQVRIAGPTGEREVDAGNFFTGAHETVLRSAELIYEVAFPPIPAGMGWAFAELSPRRRDFPLVCVAVLLGVTDATISGARIAIGGVCDRPVRAPDAEEELVGCPPSASTYGRAARAATGALLGVADGRASAGYRAQVAATLVERLLHRATLAGRPA